MEGIRERLVAELRRAGMRDVPERFSVASVHHTIPREILAGIDEFIGVFDRVTARPAWRESALRERGELAPRVHPEVCFFSAWDFHLPPATGREIAPQVLARVRVGVNPPQ